MKPELSELLLQNLKWWKPSLNFCIKISKQLGFTWRVLKPFGKTSSILSIGSYMCSYIVHFWAINTFFSSVQNNFKPQGCRFWILAFWYFISVADGMVGGLWTMDSYMPYLQKGLRVEHMSVICFRLSPAHSYLVLMIALPFLGS